MESKLHVPFSPQNAIKNIHNDQKKKSYTFIFLKRIKYLSYFCQYFMVQFVHVLERKKKYMFRFLIITIMV